MMKNMKESVFKMPYTKTLIKVCNQCGDNIYHCVNEKLGIDFITQCSCEIEKEKAIHEQELKKKLLFKSYDERLKKSNLSLKMIEMANSEFEINDNNIQAYQLINRYCNEFNRQTSLGLFLSGPCGVGKTHLIAWCVNRLLLQGEEVYFTNVNEMMDKIKKSYKEESNFELFLKTIQVLVMDDLGAEYLKEYDAKKLFEIIDTRNKNNLQTLYTSNYTINGLREKYSNGNIGLESIDADRIISRILGSCHSATINDYDHRIEAFKLRKKGGK